MSGLTTSPVCLDASVITKLMVYESDSDLYHAAWIDLVKRSVSLISPHLARYECVATVRKLVHRAGLPAAAADGALANLAALPVELVSTMEIHRRALEIAGQLGLPTAYDSHYLATAEAFQSCVWTADGGMATAARSLGIALYSPF